MRETRVGQDYRSDWQGRGIGQGIVESDEDLIWKPIAKGMDSIKARERNGSGRTPRLIPIILKPVRNGLL